MGSVEGRGTRACTFSRVVILGGRARCNSDCVWWEGAGWAKDGLFVGLFYLVLD